MIDKYNRSRPRYNLLIADINCICSVIRLSSADRDGLDQVTVLEKNQISRNTNPRLRSLTDWFSALSITVLCVVIGQLSSRDSSFKCSQDGEDLKQTCAKCWNYQKLRTTSAARAGNVLESSLRSSLTPEQTLSDHGAGGESEIW